MLDGAARLDELVAKAVRDGMPAIGMTDHGNMYGTLDFYKECNKQGIKPIIGTEAYMAYDSRTERPDPTRANRRLGRRHGGRQEALLPPDAPGREPDRVQEPDPAVEPGVHGGVLLQAPDGLGAAREVLRRTHRHHRLPRRTGAPGAPQRRREGRHRQSGAPAGHLRARQPVRRTAGPRAPGPTRHQPEAARDRQEDRRAVAGHERQPLHAPARPRVARCAPVCADRGAALRRQALQVRGQRALPEVAGRDAVPVS